VRLELLLGRFEYAATGIMDATHLRWFTAASIRRLVESAGLCVAECRASAGTWMAPYHRRLPFKLLPLALRSSLVRGATRCAPRLFGCQHVVRAVAQSAK
jgi:hypothetical protein